MSEKRVAIFSNGSQRMDWDERNCCRCTRATWEGEFVCDIQAAISAASIGGGTVAAEIAERMGYSDPLEYTWDCTEREGKDAHTTHSDNDGERR